MGAYIDLSFDHHGKDYRRLQERILLSGELPMFWDGGSSGGAGRSSELDFR